jgi:hypothetical protein
MPTKLKYSHHAEIVNQSNNGLKEEGVVNPVVCLDAELKEILKAEKREQDVENFKENEINWLEGEFWDSWDKVKGHSKKLMNHHEEYSEDDSNKLFFLAHNKDKIKGKPQLVEPVKKKIPLIKLTIKKITEGRGEDKTETEIKKVFFIDERVDTRYDGYLKNSWSDYFWLYQVITEDDKKYFILSKEKLPNEVCHFNGMLIEMGDTTDMSRSLKIPTISGFFILKDYEPTVQILTKEQIIQFTKNRKVTESDWITFLGYHRFGNVNRFPEEVEMLRSSFILAGKEFGYPNHLFIMGQSGTKKTVGQLETLSYKFEEEPEIVEGGDSRIKGLIPSFKEKPANVGYLAKANRVGFIDEIGKMVEFEATKHQSTNTNILGELNFLLEHKYRSVGSGNDNECKIQANAKYIFPTNPVKNRATIYDHVGLIDPTALSRMIIWVQDDAEVEFVMSEKAIENFPPTPTQAYTPTAEPDNTVDLYNKNKKRVISGGKCSGGCVGVGGIWGIMSREEFLTLFDTCYSFVCNIDDKEIQRLVNTSVMLAREPMKTSVWKPRASHHVKLLVDGLCKHRCLFKDYDSTFTAKQEDYDLAERILIRMVKGWDTDLQPKEDFNR